MPPLVTAAQFNLQPNLQQSFQQGLATRQMTQAEANRQQLEQLAAEEKGLRRTALGLPEQRSAQPTQGEAERELLASEKDVSEQLINSIGLDNKRKRVSALSFANEALETHDDDARTVLINERIQEITAQGGDASETLALLEGSPEQRQEDLLTLQTAIKSAEPGVFEQLMASKAAKGTGGLTKAFGPVTLVNKDTGEKILAIPTFDPNTGEASLKQGNIPEGFEISKETGVEKRAAELLITEEKAGATVTGKTVAQRRAARVDAGITAADSMANLVRAKDLLDKVKTGGVSAVAVRAKQLFGIEGADEGELSNRLSKAVLGQLRETFGAAFTENEGKRLERIEAGIGKSTEGNRRIIEQSMKMVRRAAQRGIRAALAIKDEESAQDIREALAFSLDTDQPQGVNVGKFIVEVE